MTPSLHLHIERVVIDESVHRAGPAAIRAALIAGLPTLLPSLGRPDQTRTSFAIADSVAARVPTPAPRPPK